MLGAKAHVHSLRISLRQLVKHKNQYTLITNSQPTRPICTSQVCKRRVQVYHLKDYREKHMTDPLKQVPPKQTISNAKQYLEVEDNLNLVVHDKDGETIIEAEPRKTGRESLVVNSPDHSCGGCALCRLNLKGLDYTDVMILSQFIKRDGSLATRHESKLCNSSYYRVKRLIHQAQRCNLIKRPDNYFRPGTWHDMNTYLERDRNRDQPMTVVKKEYWRI